MKHIILPSETKTIIGKLEKIFKKLYKKNVSFLFK